MTARMIMKMDVTARDDLGDGIVRLSFRHPRRPSLPTWTPGAHVDLRLPDGKVRQYSLVGDHADTAVYTIAVKREPNGRGGSALVHKMVRAGDVAHVSAPRNNFPLQDGPAVFVAGGIGVTPMISMARELAQAGRPFAFHLCVRDPGMPLIATLRALCGEQLHVHCSANGPADRLDVSRLIEGLDPETHIYCCGPERLTAAVEAAAAEHPEDHVHFEVFTASLDENFKPEPFTVTVASTGQEYLVPENRSALDVLREAGFALPSSCELGVCGSCECGYSDGTIIHRDVVLRHNARQSRMMLCVSRARVNVTLDL